MKRNSPACERNQSFILKQLKDFFPKQEDFKVLEIASGTGQHALYFANEFPNMTWQPSDLKENFSSIESWAAESKYNNIRKPLLLDLNASQKLSENFDFFYSSNCLHIIPEELISNFFKICADQSSKKSILIIYGPFRYQGQYTSESNKEFDLWLKQNVSPKSAIRDLELVKALASPNGFHLVKDISMPANNQLLVFGKEYFS